MYRVVISGRQVGTDSTVVASRLAKLFNASDEQIQNVLSAPRYVAKQGLTLELAHQYQRAIAATGAECILEEELSTSLAVDLPEATAKDDPSKSNPSRSKSSSVVGPRRGVSLLSKLVAGLLFVSGAYSLWSALHTNDSFAPPGHFLAHASAKGIADQIIKRDLASPNSFSSVSKQVLWFSERGEETAYIVRTEYDALNKFGASLRDCRYLGFVTSGEKFTHNPRDGQQACDDRLDDPQWDEWKKKLVPILIANFGFQRFTGKATVAAITEAPRVTPSAQPNDKKPNVVAKVTLTGIVAPPVEQGDQFTLKLQTSRVFDEADCGKQPQSEIELWAAVDLLQRLVGKTVTATGELDCPRGGYVLRNLAIGE